MKRSSQRVNGARSINFYGEKPQVREGGSAPWLASSSGSTSSRSGSRRYGSSRPSPEDVAKTEDALRKFGKTYEFHTYENAGHAFFAVDRPQYRVHAAVDGWKKVFARFEKHLR